MSQLRLNPLVGRWVTVSAARADRPSTFVSRQVPVAGDPSRPCPFCPGNEEATPPALETYGPSGTWLVRVVPNLFPAFHGGAPMAVEHIGPVFTQAPASGIHEVLVFTPTHGTSWADLDDRQAGLVMAAIRDRMEDHAGTAGVRYSQAIVNHGREAGASMEHGHGQLLGIPFVPEEIATEEAGFARFAGGCLLCTTAQAEADAGHRLLLETEGAVAICPFWSGTPYEALVIPRQCTGHLDRATPADLVAVGRILRDTLSCLHGLLGDVSYNLVFHTAPHHSEHPFHWHVHVLPKITTQAGFELGTGVLINIVPPELAAQQLRGARVASAAGG